MKPVKVTLFLAGVLVGAAAFAGLEDVPRTVNLPEGALNRIVDVTDGKIAIYKRGLILYFQ